MKQYHSFGKRAIFALLATILAGITIGCPTELPEDDPVLQNIVVTTPPAKTVYIIGEALNLSGLVVTGTYSDGATKAETVNLSNISGYNANTTGTQTLTVTVNGKTTTFTVTVNSSALQSIAVTTPPAKTVYITGEALDLSGLVVTGTYSDGVTKAETVSLANISGYNADTAEQQTLTVTIDGKTTTFTVTVNNSALQSIAVTTPPAKTVYITGEALDLSGLEVTGTYTDGTTKVETVGLANISGYNADVTGTQTLTVTINDKTATFTVTVNPGDGPVLQSIAVTTQPAKTVYVKGEALNLSGLVVTGTYSDGTTKLETVSLSNISGYAPNTTGGQTLTITIDGKTTTFTVTVEGYAVTFDANGGVLEGGGGSITLTALANGSLSLPSTTRNGYTLNGWYTASSGGTKAGNAGSSYTPSASVTLYAQWSQSLPTTYTVTFIVNGGSAVSSQMVNAGNSLILPSTTRNGYTFNGWYTASSGGTKAGNAGSSYTPSASVTLYAQWSQPLEAPGIPANVTATAQSSSSIRVSWSAVSGATNYDVYYEIGDSTTKNFAANVSGTSYTHTGLQASTAYYYYIKANNSAGASGYSSFGYATTSSSSSGGTTVPSAPTGVSATASTESPYVINLAWNSVSGATTYRIYYGSSSSNITTLLFTVYAPTTSYMDTSNQPNSTRYYKVSAVNSNGESSKSTTVSAKTSSSSGSGTTVPSAPTGVSATTSGQLAGSVRVTWNAVSGATGYRVYYSKSATGQYYEDGTSFSTGYTSTGWTGSGTAYFKVKAVNTAGESALSSYASASLSP
jgi:uncharacterized repeat protein (TIGR02543 family)